MKIFKFQLTLLLFCLSANIFSQNTLTENSKISLLTVGPGNEVADAYGHTAIRIKDLNKNIDYAFHYGLYDFNTPGFVMKFLRGKLMYQMGAQKMESFTAQYDRDKRTVYEQVLDLDLTQRNKLYDALKENYKPENRKYLYDFFFYNCATIVGDRMESHIGELQLPQDRDAKTFRNMIDEFQQDKPWMDFGVDLIIGSIADDTTTVAEQLFLPLYIHDVIKDTYVNGKQLVIEENLILNYIAKNSSDSKKRFTPRLLFMILVILEMILLAGFFLKWEKAKTIIKTYDKIWYLLLGIGSLILIFMWFATDHLATKDNWNLFWMNPFYLVLFFALWKGKGSFINLVYMSLILVCLLTLMKFPAQFQELHPASYLLVIVSTLKLLRGFLGSREKVGVA